MFRINNYIILRYINFGKNIILNLFTYFSKTIIELIFKILIYIIDLNVQTQRIILTNKNKHVKNIYNKIKNN